jgi:anti-sigma-K factor RskA
VTGPNERDERNEPDAGDRLARAASDELAAYALDAVDAEERAAIERALAESDELRDEADTYAETATRLADLAEPIAPPRDLRERLMAQLDTTPQVAPDAAVEPAPAPAPAPAVVPAPGPAESAARRRWFQRPGAIIGATAAAILLIAGAVIGIGWPGPNGWGAQREMIAISEAPDAQTTTLEAAGGGEVTLVSSAAQGRSVVIAEGLADVGSDHTYELWYIDDSGAASAGTFDTSGAETWRVLEGAFAPGVAVGVTVEPAGGSPQPTTEPIVVIVT